MSGTLIKLACSLFTIVLLVTPALGADTPSNLPDDAAVRAGGGHRHGAGDGSGSGNGSRWGDCPIPDAAQGFDEAVFLTRGGHGGGGNGGGGHGGGGNGSGGGNGNGGSSGNGPGDGTGTGSGPQDGTGNGKKSGACINS